MKKTGELLKQKRESANLSVSEVALATKINPKILTAIENGDESNLPAKTFLKGFVRSYALFLKMDVDEVMRQFMDETGGPPPAAVHEAYRQPEPNAQPAPRRRPPEEGSSGLRTAAIVVIALLIGLIIGVRELIEKYQREKIVSASDVKVSPLVTPPVVPQPSAPTVAIEAESKKEEPKKEEPKVAAEKPAMEVAPVSVSPIPFGAQRDAGITKPSEPKEPVKPVAEESKKEEPKKEVAASATQPESALKGVKNEISLEALDKVDVEFKVHGEMKRLSLAPTQVHTIRSDGPLVLDLSDGGAVNIILNGHERGVPGDLGKPKQVKIP